MDKERLQKIYRKTDGNCHICHGKLNFSNYAALGANSGWEVEHSKPKSKGGSDNLNNLFAAHITCNRGKGTLHTKTARSHYGNTRAPYSKSKKQKIKNNNTTGGALIGGSIGLAVGGSVGGLIGSFVGGLIGNESSPKR
jgi:5-methylcytosine-specific restriction endonuclease McrA